MSRYKVATLLDLGVNYVFVDADDEDEAERKAAEMAAGTVQPDEVITWIDGKF